MSSDLRTLPARAADFIDQVGWTQGTDRDGTGRVCLTGALRHCDPQPGDWLIAREVVYRQGYYEGWNDDPSRTQAEVQAALRGTEITDAELARTFGPRWQTVVELVRTAAMMTPDQAGRLAATRVATLDAARVAARGAALGALGAAGDEARGAARAALGTAGVAARGAAWDVTLGTVVWDLIGQHGFTAEHYDLLTGPWVSVMGPLAE